VIISEENIVWTPYFQRSRTENGDIQVINAIVRGRRRRHGKYDGYGCAMISRTHNKTDVQRFIREKLMPLLRYLGYNETTHPSRISVQTDGGSPFTSNEEAFERNNLKNVTTTPGSGDLAIIENDNDRTKNMCIADFVERGWSDGLSRNKKNWVGFAKQVERSIRKAKRNNKENCKYWKKMLVDNIRRKKECIAKNGGKVKR
jgi:hypothetical protein